MSRIPTLDRLASLSLAGAIAIAALPGIASATPAGSQGARTSTIPGPDGGQRRIVRYRTAGLRVTSMTDHHPNGQVTMRSLFTSRVSPESTLVVTELGSGRPERVIVTHQTGRGGSRTAEYGVGERIPQHMMPDQPEPPFPGAQK